MYSRVWMVQAMLDLVKGETERIDSRFLEPACGSGNFLVQILKRKLAAAKRAARKGQARRARALRKQARNLKRRAKRCNRRQAR